VEQRDHVQHVLEQWRRETPELDPAPMGIVGRIRRLALLLNAEIEPVFEAHGLNGGEFDVLTALRRTGRPFRLTPTELSEALIVTSGGMTKRLAALEGDGLIRREPDPHDGRSTVVTLTPKGRRLVETILAEHLENAERLLSGLSTSESTELAGLLQVLAISLGDRAEDASRSRRRRRRRIP
jgi:DNA-binding MarR family transcriptional regulator